jgi:hypothetical protein
MNLGQRGVSHARTQVRRGGEEGRAGFCCGRRVRFDLSRRCGFHNRG